MSQVPASELFQPPVNRSMTELDRSFFQKTVPISAVAVSDTKFISNVRNTLIRTGEALNIGGLKPIVDDETKPGAKCVVLDPHISKDKPEEWSPQLSALIKSGTISIRPYDLKLTYDDFSMSQILEAILPVFPEDEKETPTGFSQAGHVAHLNLRAPYLPYKHLIGQVLADKNPQIKTVINKTLDVGTDSVYRTFPYEVLSGPDDLNVTVSESGCEFQFDFAKVYWNSRLGTEHERIVAKFQPGEAVCDVMAGVGPFALPAGKKHVFVRANDLNPDSYASLSNGIVKNKVVPFVLASCVDGREFIRTETRKLRETQRKWVQPPPKVSRNARKPNQAATTATQATSPSQSSPSSTISTATTAMTNTTTVTTKKRETLIEPTTFDHYVMNLPATAVEFLDAFRGIHQGQESEFEPTTKRKLPMIHVYTFQAKKPSEREEMEEICSKISHYLGGTIKPPQRLDPHASGGGDDNSNNNHNNNNNNNNGTDQDPSSDIEIFNVRLVAPQKSMYCASFRLPATVAFATTNQPS